MKALVLKNPGEAVIQLVPDLVRVPDQVLLRVRNVEFCGTDLSSFRGTNPLITYPRILGHEVAATVVEESSLRPDLIQGTNVMVSPYASCGNCPSCRRNGPNGCQFNQTMGVQRDGALTEFIQVPVDKVFPADLSIMDLCMVEPLTVGFHAVARGRVAAEDTVAVIGCGGVGLGAVAGASFRKACTIAIDVDATKRFYQDHGSARLKTGRGEYPGMLTPVKHTSSVRIRPSLFPIGQMVPFSLVTILFFLWGVPNNLNDVLIRQFMTSFAITRFQAGLVQSAFYLGYFLLAMPAAMLMRRAGYKTGIVTGLVLFGTGTLLFWPAAIVDRYGFFLFALFVIASGLAFLETAANPFIAEIGDAESSEQRLNFSQAFNPIGAISGVAIGTTFIFSGVELTPPQIRVLKASHQYAAYLQSETLRVVMPYIVLGAVAFILAAVIASVRFPETRSSSAAAGKGSGGPRLPHLLRRPFFMFSVAAQFLYVGAQVGTWSYFIQYVQDYAHQPVKTAGYFLTGSLFAFAVGRFASAWLMRFVNPGRLMGIYSVANVILVTIGVTNPGWIGMWSIFLTSFFMSLMFPTIFAMGLRGLGEDTKLGGSLLVMAIVGGAVLTPVMGLISSRSLAFAYLVPLGCYVFIMFYSFAGARVLRHQELPA